MHLKRRGQRAALYRSRWIKKGAEQNTHGFAAQEFITSLPLTAQQIPDAVRVLLSPEEQAWLELAVCVPARQAAAQAHSAALQRERDPVWRLDSALVLLSEAADRSRHAPIPLPLLAKLADVLARMQPPPEPQVVSSVPKTDALKSAADCLRLASEAVRSGDYGRAPKEGARGTRVYKLWTEIFEQVAGTGSDTLLRSLQEAGFVKSRQR